MRSAVVSLDRFLDHILSSDLELMEGFFALSLTYFFGTAFMAAYLTSLAATGLTSVGCPPVLLSAAAWGTVTPAISSLGGVGIQGGPSVMGMGGPGTVDAHRDLSVCSKPFDQARE